MVVSDDKGGYALTKLLRAGGRVAAREPGRAVVVQLGDPTQMLAATRRRSFAEVMAALDVSDVSPAPDPAAKKHMQHSPIPVPWEAWEKHGYARHLVERLKQGCHAPVLYPPPRTDYGSYPEKEPGDDWEIVAEMHRCVERGAMTWEEDESKLKLIHPWVVVHQKGKVRACQDLSN